MGIGMTLTIERFAKSGRRLERRVMPSRSLLMGLIQLLYVHHSMNDLSSGVNHIRVPYISGNFSLTRDIRNLQVASPGGIGAMYNSSDYSCGDEVGIQIGTGTKALDARDRSLDKKIAPNMGRELSTLLHPGTGNPRGLAWDGTYLFVVDNVSPTSKIYRINRYTDEVITSFNAPGNSYSYNEGLCYDGTYLWVTGYDSGKSPYYRVYKISAVDGTPVLDWGAPNSRRAYGLAWDGANIWCADSGGAYQLNKCNPANGNILTSITPPYNTSAYSGLAWDGAYLWGVSGGGGSRYYGGATVCQIDPAGGALLKEFLTATGGDGSNFAYPWGLTWAEGYLWLSTYSPYAVGRLIQQICANKVRFDYGGCEVVDDESYVNPSGSFTVRRYFINKSGGSITVNEVGIHALAREIAIARDIVSPGVAVADNQVLKVEYAVQITV